VRGYSGRLVVPAESGSGLSRAVTWFYDSESTVGPSAMHSSRMTGRNGAVMFIGP